ncbi:uncharacterized protein LOC116024532 [Ipomoea triloba]|uniref:uncharacterized protein LOC116024532 n=1 Tax=Ipomoea triloba TaxID=35885 RepID=UPI00125E85BA|nr:uncharacterized protein LOC116024532 [Ipomoea triloba]
MSSGEQTQRRSCAACFTALCSCYTPVHQMQQYYRLGALDNCYDKWSALFDCLRLKTKQPAEVEEALKKQGQAKPHIWTFRTPEEASVYWNKLFGQIINKKK